MTELSRPWPEVATGDGGEFSDEQWARVWRYLFQQDLAAAGVIPGVANKLQVTGATSPVSVNTGAGMVYGRFYENDAAVDVAIPTPAASARIDRVVLECGWTAQTIRITRVAGTEGGSEPTLTQTGGTTWQVPLAKVTIQTDGTLVVVDQREYLYGAISLLYKLVHAGPTNGYVLKADSSEDDGVVFGINPVEDKVTSKGDLLVATAADTLSRLAAGTNGQFLKADSGETCGVAWSTAPGNPPGALIPFAGESVPTGYLECNGAAVSRTTYSDLFTAIGVLWGVGDGSTTFNIPDFRGFFPRGWDHSAGNDPDTGSRTGGDHVGSSQTDQYKSHTHTMNSAQGGSTSQTHNTFAQGWEHNAGSNTTNASGGNETRPENKNVMYIIKT